VLTGLEEAARKASDPQVRAEAAEVLTDFAEKHPSQWAAIQEITRRLTRLAFHKPAAYDLPLAAGFQPTALRALRTCLGSFKGVSRDVGLQLENEVVIVFIETRVFNARRLYGHATREFLVKQISVLAE
jgi:hypothetical protein